MSDKIQKIKLENNRTVYRFVSHRRTITETDLVNFVNLTGLHAAPFIDMGWVADNMPGDHNKRFAPAPFLISLASGLVTTRSLDVVDIMTKDEKLGPFHGGIYIEANIKKPVFVSDTLWVELEAQVDRKTKNSQTLVDFKHTLKNQLDKTVMIYTEKILFDPY